MKKIFFGVTVKKEPDYKKLLKEIEKIPEKNVAICYSNQFVNVAKKIKEKIDKEVIEFFQVLGCSNPKFDSKTEAILIIGQGTFHSVSLAYESKLPTYILENSNVKKITKKEIEEKESKEKKSIMRFIANEKVGILITNKPGQMRIEKAIEFKRKLKSKKSYLFLDNNLDISQFENFGLNSWVNTACPRMDLTDGPIINLDKIPKELIK